MPLRVSFASFSGVADTDRVLLSKLTDKPLSNTFLLRDKEPSPNVNIPKL